MRKANITGLIFETFLSSMLISLAATAVYAATLDRSRSEMPGLVYGIVAFCIVALSLSTLSLYLLAIPRVVNTALLRSGAYFLMPGLTAISLFASLQLYSEWVLFLLIAVPFFSILMIQYFRRS